MKYEYWQDKDIHFEEQMSGWALSLDRKTSLVLKIILAAFLGLSGIWLWCSESI